MWIRGFLISMRLLLTNMEIMLTKIGRKWVLTLFWEWLLSEIVLADYLCNHFLLLSTSNHIRVPWFLIFGFLCFLFWSFDNFSCGGGEHFNFFLVSDFMKLLCLFFMLWVFHCVASHDDHILELISGWLHSLCVIILFIQVYS